MNGKNILKIVAGILATIILGAVGSGVWERFLSPLVDLMYIKVVELFSYLSSSYLDSIYRDAIYLNVDFVSVNTYTFLLLALTMTLVLYSLSKQTVSKSVAKSVSKTCNIMFKSVFSSMFWGAFLILIMIVDISTSTSAKLSDYSKESMEIVRPYVGENNYRTLYSEFLRVNNKDSYMEYHKKLENYSAEFEVPLDKYELP
ncbi:MAG: hypothetical protein KAS49_03125 [Candidatus Cloacimonetes bacterium]|nr:hypothetical protein [Candidatus Cloacimonadota bacterium]